MRRLVAMLIDAILVPSLTLVRVMITRVVEDAEDDVDVWWRVWVPALAVLSRLHDLARRTVVVRSSSR